MRRGTEIPTNVRSRDDNGPNGGENRRSVRTSLEGYRLSAQRSRDFPEPAQQRKRRSFRAEDKSQYPQPSSEFRITFGPCAAQEPTSSWTVDLLEFRRKSTRLFCISE